jgi:hypothetical protein
MIRNTFWFRHFLICSKLANEVLGLMPQNFALLIIEQEQGRAFNSQMTNIFWLIDAVISELHSSESREVFDMIEDEGLCIDDLAKLTTDELSKYYQDYCFETFKI